MKALVYLGPGRIALAEKEQPVLQQPSGAIVRVVKIIMTA